MCVAGRLGGYAFAHLAYKGSKMIHLSRTKDRIVFFKDAKQPTIIAEIPIEVVRATAKLITGLADGNEVKALLTIGSGEAITISLYPGHIIISIGGK